MAAGHDDGEPRALVRAEPPFHLARSLAEAGPRDFLNVDRHGRVRSPARYKVTVAAAYTATGLSAGYLLVSLSSSFGLLGGGFAVAFLGWVGWRLRHGRQVSRASRLIVDERLDEAEALLRPAATSRLGHRRFRGIAWLNLSGIAARRGRHAEALTQAREALRLLRPRDLFHALAGLSEVSFLIELGQLDQASKLMALRHAEVPRGEFLQQAHWTTQLYLGLALDHHAIDDEELHRRARFALGLTTSSSLLALLAWAHHHRDDTDQAWFLLRESFERSERVPIAESMPRLHTWIEAHRAEAMAAAPPAE